MNGEGTKLYTKLRALQRSKDLREKLGNRETALAANRIPAGCEPLKLPTDLAHYAGAIGPLGAQFGLPPQTTMGEAKHKMHIRHLLHNTRLEMRAEDLRISTLKTETSLNSFVETCSAAWEKYQASLRETFF